MQVVCEATQALLVGSSVAGVLGLGLAGVCFDKVRKRRRILRRRRANAAKQPLLKGETRTWEDIDEQGEGGAPAAISSREERVQLFKFLTRTVRKVKPHEAAEFRSKCAEYGQDEISAADYVAWLDEHLGVRMVDHSMRALLQLLLDDRKRQLLMNAYALQRGKGGEVKQRISFTAPGQAPALPVAAAAVASPRPRRSSSTARRMSATDAAALPVVSPQQDMDL